MKLTPFAKLFITFVIVAVVGYAFWHYKGQDVRRWAVGRSDSSAGGSATPVSSSDFDALKNAPPDPGRGSGRRRGDAGGAVGFGQARPSAGGGHQHLGGPRAGHRGQRRPRPGAGQSRYTKRYGLAVKFVLIEDPAAKLAAFRKGDVDIMWNTVDNWAREASILAEQNQKARSILMQDWSRGGDGIVSLASIKSIEDLKGKRIACTQFTPSHFLLLYLLVAVRPVARGPGRRREEHHLHAGRPGGRRDVQGAARWMPP